VDLSGSYEEINSFEAQHLPSTPPGPEKPTLYSSITDLLTPSSRLESTTREELFAGGCFVRTVASSPVALRWMCDSPRTGCARRITPIHTLWHEQAIIEWSWWTTFNNACEPGEQLIVLPDGDDESDLVERSLLLLAATMLKLCAHAARAFRSRQY